MGFVLKILEKFGFSFVWINWMKQCISTSSLSILINGSPFGCFQPSRGFRQGDPLSPYLFILCSEVVSKLLIREEHRKRLKGIKLGHHAPTISHLLFADNLLLFARATTLEATTLNDCLEKYMS